MASSAQFTVTNASATLLVAAVAHETRQVLLHVEGGNVFVGGDSSVTTANGYKIDSTKSSGTAITLHGGEALYGITTSGSHTVYVLVTEI
jgi:hypothetical protein